MNRIFTIGHSTRKIEEFIGILKEYEIGILVDVRTIPKSRYNPQYNNDALERVLKEQGIKYIHEKKLGGLRHAKKNSKNQGWKNASFRGFADYMQSKEFLKGIKELIKNSKEKRTIIMCAESVPWKCHRMLIADSLIIRKIPVIHIISKNESKKHEITNFAKVREKEITYPKTKKLRENAPTRI